MPVGFHNSATEQFLRDTALENPDRQAVKGLATALGSYNIVDIKIGGQIRSLTGLIGSAVPARYPKLPFVIAEGGIGWVPSVIRLMDHWWEDHHHYSNPSWTSRRASITSASSGTPSKTIARGC